MYYFGDSILDQSKISLERARTHLNNSNLNTSNLINSNSTRNKSVSVIKNPLKSTNYYNKNPKIILKKRIRTKSIDSLVSNEINNMINNNRKITDLNVELSNKLNSLNHKSDNNLISNFNIKKYELIEASEILKKELKNSNDRNYQILNLF